MIVPEAFVMRITSLIVAGFLVIAGTGFYLLLRNFAGDVERQYSQAAEEPLVELAHLFASLIEQDIDGGAIDPGRFRAAFRQAHDRRFLATIYNLEKTTIATHVYVTDRNGVVIFDSDEGRREGENYADYNDVFLTLRGEYGVRSSRTDPDDSRTSVFYVAAPIRHRGETIGVLSVSRPETVMAPFAEETRARVLTWGFATGALVILLAGAWAYGWLHPIGDLARHAREVAEGRRSELRPTGRAELRLLSRNLESMRRELEGKHYVEHYVEALTHELKSPLAAIRGAAELIDESMPPGQRRRFLENILAETARTEDLVRRLLQLASIETRSSLGQTQLLDFASLVREECDSFAARGQTKSVAIDCSLLPAQTIPLSGDPLMLRLAVRNLLDNAIDFSPPQSTVTVTLDKNDETVLLRIHDEGPGIPAYAAERVFDRFYSLKNRETGRKGSGIGLSIVRETAILHGGQSTLRTRDEGGAEAQLELPLEAR